MERGLLWLLLLGVFFWLAYSGWNEYQKVEAYRRWAGEFDRAKYDIYSVLAQKGTDLTWGKPTRSGPIELKTFSLKDVKSIHLLVDDKPVDLDNPHRGAAVSLQFVFSDKVESIAIPFTEIPLATQWGKYLQQELQRLSLEPTD